MNRTFAATAVMIVLTSGAATAEDSGWYAGFDLGAAFTESDTEFFGENFDSLEGVPNITLEDSGVVYGLSAGYDFRGRLRAGLELRSRELSDSSGAINGHGLQEDDLFSLEGSIQSTALMATAFFDIRPIGRFEPYIKAGMGVAFNEAEGVAVIETTSQTSEDENLGLAVDGVLPSDDSTEFAWELGVGLALPLTDRVTLDFGYQYVDLGDAAAGFDANGDSVRFTDLASHETTAGLRFSF